MRDITVKNEGMSYLDDWIKMKKDESYEIIRAKYDEVLRAVDENGILEGCEKHFLIPDGGKWGDSVQDFDDYPVYSAGCCDFNFAIYDVDRDGKEELLIDWYDYYNWESYGEGFVDVLQYYPETDSLLHEAVIPTNRWYVDYVYYQPDFYDNGVIISYLPWVNAGSTGYVRQFEYDAASDKYVYKDGKYGDYPYDMYEGYGNMDVVDAWDKITCPEIRFDKWDNEGNIISSQTIPFPDESDLDGDGRLYYKFEPGQHMYDCEYDTVSLNISQWRDISEISELNIPVDRNRKLDIEWYDIHTYVETGKPVSSERSMSKLYGKFAAKYYSRNYNDSSLSDSQKNYIFYALSDLNSDGADELMLGISSEIDGKIYYDKLQIYTYKDGQAYLIAYDDDEQWNDYSIYENGVCHVEGRGTGYHLDVFYRLPEHGTKLEPIETVYYEAPWEPTGNPVTHYYHNMGGNGSEEAQEITEEEYNGIYGKYIEKQPELHYMTQEMVNELTENGIQ